MPDSLYVHIQSLQEVGVNILVGFQKLQIIGEGEQGG